ncbi:MAG TPA: hypothetical protein VIU38_00285 [Anaerolineales bacterium]
MTNKIDLAQLDAQGKKDFEAGRFQEAAEAFKKAAQGYADLGDALNSAEQKNNLSVALLQLQRPQEALEAASRTDEVFAAAGDVKRQGMALNNQAVALEELNREEDALAAYERAAQLLGEAGEGDLRATVLKAAAAIDLKRGKIGESGMKMIGALGSTQKPTLLQRVLRWVLRLAR